MVAIDDITVTIGDCRITEGKTSQLTSRMGVASDTNQSPNLGLNLQDMM